MVPKSTQLLMTTVQMQFEISSIKMVGDWQKVKDDNGAIAVAFGVARVPETWIIDPNGMVRLRITGELSPGLLSEQVNKLRDGFTS